MSLVALVVQIIRQSQTHQGHRAYFAGAVQHLHGISTFLTLSDLSGPILLAQTTALDHEWVRVSRTPEVIGGSA